MVIIPRIARYFRPHWPGLLLSMVCMGVVGGTAGVSAWLVKPVLDGIFIHKDAQKLQLLPLAILGLYLVKGVCRYAQSYILRWVGETVVLRMRVDLLANLEYRDLTFFDRNTTGHLLARVTNDVGAMQRAIPDLIQLGRQAFTVAGLIFVLFQRDWKLAGLALVIFPLAAYPMNRITVLMRRYARKSQERIGDMANILQEAFSGIEVVKIFGSEEREVARLQAEGERLRRVQLKSARLNEVT
ncbi:MAG: ABC transporter ATP-binding protein, partial [Deltaproteobacteria bacterium]|nr:ABC transporter ATP-binding protein [Deltaproteobacteria bacterium]